MRRISFFVSFTFVFCLFLLFPKSGHTTENIVYSIYQGVDLGAGEIPTFKDYYITLGTSQGIHTGSIVEVSRRVSTYDVMSEKLYKEMTVPIARLKVIHAEAGSAIARLDKLAPPDKTPAISPYAVIVGDLVEAK